MASEYELVRYRAEHREGVLALQRNLWGPDRGRNDAYFAWKYESNPYLTGPAITLALHRGRVVGMRGLIGARWRVGDTGRTADLPFVDDLVVDPAHRERGLATRLIRATLSHAAELGSPFVISLRAGSMTLMGSLAAGFRSLGAMGPVVRTQPGEPRRKSLRARLAGSERLARLTGALGLPALGGSDPFQYLDAWAVSRSRAGGDPVQVTAEAPVEPMASLFGRQTSDGRIGQVRDAAFLRWIFRNPRLDYRFVYLGSDRQRGVLVLHRVRFGPGTGGRVEMAEWEAESEAVAESLLAVVIEQGKFGELMTWTATLPPFSGAILSRHGFAPGDLAARTRGLPAALVFATREDQAAWNFEGIDAIRFDNWRFRLLDQD